MLFAAAAEAASNGEEQTQTSPENGPQIARSRTIEICGLEQSHVFEFKALVRPCHSLIAISSKLTSGAEQFPDCSFIASVLLGALRRDLRTR
jgi:hypothetical protein